MTTGNVGDVRYLRRSLAWAGVSLLGGALLVTLFLGFWSTRIVSGGMVYSTTPQLVFLTVAGVSLALVVGGIVGVQINRRRHAHSYSGLLATPQK